MVQGGIMLGPGRLYKDCSPVAMSLLLNLYSCLPSYSRLYSQQLGKLCGLYVLQFALTPRLYQVIICSVSLALTQIDCHHMHKISKYQNIYLSDNTQRQNK